VSRQPIVSIIIPSWNRGELLYETVESCLAQKGVEIDLIVVDDGSTDDSIDRIKSAFQEVKVYSQEHKGACIARNLGMRAARGEYIKFVDSDDLLAEDIIQKQIDVLESSDCDVLYGDFEMFGKLDDPRVGGKPLRITGEVKDPVVALLSEWWCAPFCYLYKRDVLEQICWREDLECLQDLDFILKVALSGARFKYSPGIVGYYRTHEGQITNSGSEKYARNRCSILDNIKKSVMDCNKWSGEIKYWILNGYWSASRYYYQADRQRFNEIVNLINREHPGFRPALASSGRAMNLLIRIFGISLSEHIYGIFYKKRKNQEL